jgi:S1-C subfamily serine protease
MKHWIACVCVWGGIQGSLVAAAAEVGPLRAFGTQVADVVEQVLPSVVVIRTEAIRYHLGRDYFFGQLYRIPERTAGQGSGVIISPDGYVLTSYHVVERAGQIEVVMDDGAVFSAEMVGGDPHTDLAVVRIRTEEARTFPAVEFGDSDAVRVGEVVIAIGSPYNLHSTVTLGIVSQKGRVIGMLPYEDFIQTQAPINPGNSGGPLVDAEGRMVGINAAIHQGGARASGNIGIGFAVPVNLAIRVAGSLISTGEIQHPWIGVMMQPAVDGVLIQEVFRDSPAERAGVRRGDLLVAINQRPVKTPLDVRRMIFQQMSSEPIRISVVRGDRTLDLDIEPEPMPEINWPSP